MRNELHNKCDRLHFRSARACGWGMDAGGVLDWPDVDLLLWARLPTVNFNSHSSTSCLLRAGQGAYHGKFGFETFSHRKAVFHQSSVRMLDVGPLR